jgi:hypothetical protein
MVSSSLTDIPVQSCGSGEDQWWGPGTRPADCEATACLNAAWRYR